MRQVVSDALGDFSAIYDEDVEVVCVTRPQASTCKTFADQLISARQVPQLRWVQAANDPDAPSKVLPCLLYTSPSPRDLSTSRMPSSA